MKTIITSIYVGNITKKDKNDDKHFKTDAVETYEKYKNSIIENHKKYAHITNSDYFLFENDETFRNFLKKYNEKYPTITNYNILNYYKFHIAEILTMSYDRVLYVDFDAVFNTKDNFFIENPNKLCFKLHQGISSTKFSINKTTNIGIPKLRLKKMYFIQKALELMNVNLDSEEWGVINTGVMSYNKKNIEQLNFFEVFDKIIPNMISYNDNCSVDNEVVLSCGQIKNKVDVHHLDEKWNFYAKKRPFPNSICHFTKKESMKEFFND